MWAQELIDLVAQRVLRCIITPSSTLIVEFEHGATLSCSPHDQWEAWQIIQHEPYSFMVCVPGGGELAVWGEDLRRDV